MKKMPKEIWVSNARNQYIAEDSSHQFSVMLDDELSEDVGAQKYIRADYAELNTNIGQIIFWAVVYSIVLCFLAATVRAEAWTELGAEGEVVDGIHERSVTWLSDKCQQMCDGINSWPEGETYYCEAYEAAVGRKHECLHTAQSLYAEQFYEETGVYYDAAMVSCCTGKYNWQFARPWNPMPACQKLIEDDQLTEEKCGAYIDA